jgi:hypothetical protein
VNIQRPSRIESFAGLTFVARLRIRLQILTIYRLGKNTGTGRLPHPTRSAEQIRLRQLVIHNRIPQSRGNGELAYYRIETGWSVFPG